MYIPTLGLIWQSMCSSYTDATWLQANIHPGPNFSGRSSYMAHGFLNNFRILLFLLN